MKKIVKFFSIILFILCFTIALTACEKITPSDGGGGQSGEGGGGQSGEGGGQSGSGQTGEGGGQSGEGGGGATIDIPDPVDGKIDYASAVKLDLNSTDTIKYEVSVKSFIDGDTTHFFLPASNSLGEEFVKARYIAINTPESTGKIEPYGKKASKFTKARLQEATSIYIECDGNKWDADSTGSRYLLWVWYKTKDDTDYRNLNIEILQEGLAIASNSAQNRYGSVAVQAINQAKELKLNIYSGENDPEMYYGTAVEATLKEIRLNIADYNGIKVAFEGVVTKDYSQTVYVEDYDEELGIYFGMQVYYGFGADGEILNALGVGNRVRVVGTVQYYENGGTYQVAGLQYNRMKPDDPENTKLIEEGHKAAYTVTTPEKFLSNVDVEISYEDDNGNEEVETKSFKYAALVMSSSIQMNDLYVTSASTTQDEASSSYGAMTLTCTCNGKTITVRTVVLYADSAKTQLVTADAYLNKTITVKGIVDYFGGTYQIKVYSAKQIIVNE